MPLFDGKCFICGTIVRDLYRSVEDWEYAIYAYCPGCKDEGEFFVLLGDDGSRRYRGVAPAIESWEQGRYFENCNDMTFYSREEMKRYMKDHNISWVDGAGFSMNTTPSQHTGKPEYPPLQEELEDYGETKCLKS